MYAKTIRDLLKATPLTEDFYSGLDAFQLNYIEMCFKKSLDEQIGMMGEVEFHNYQIFLRYKNEYLEEFYPEIKKGDAKPHKKAS
ncbi:MAG: hypothetical protein ACLGG7_04860 [Bacteriovoracia bacterium]